MMSILLSCGRENIPSIAKVHAPKTQWTDSDRCGRSQHTIVAESGFGGWRGCEGHCVECESWVVLLEIESVEKVN
jgi:hypothetical protein